MAFVYLHVNSHRRDAAAERLLRPVTLALDAGLAPNGRVVAQLARAPFTRRRLHSMLRLADRDADFPAAHATPVELAASDLAYWLAHGNELTTPPDEIEHLQTIDSPDGDAQAHLFRFRVRPPHWAASKGWMVGIAGPYPRAEPTSNRHAMPFSQLDPVQACSLGEHAERCMRAVAGGRWEIWRSG